MSKQTADALVQQPPAPEQAGTPVRTTGEEAPPFLGSWRNVYVLVVAELAVLVAIFYVLTRWAS